MTDKPKMTFSAEVKKKIASDMRKLMIEAIKDFDNASR